MKDGFKESTPFERRVELSKKILDSYPDRVPVIVQRSPACNSDVPEIKRKKFLAPADITVAKFLAEIRKYIALPPAKGIFIFVGDNVMPQPAAVMATVYQQHKDVDGFLYIQYSDENIFG